MRICISILTALLLWPMTIAQGASAELTCRLSGPQGPEHVVTFRIDMATDPTGPPRAVTLMIHPPRPAQVQAFENRRMTLSVEAPIAGSPKEAHRLVLTIDRVTGAAHGQYYAAKQREPSTGLEYTLTVGPMALGICTRTTAGF